MAVQLRATSAGGRAPGAVCQCWRPRQTPQLQCPSPAARKPRQPPSQLRPEPSSWQTCVASSAWAPPSFCKRAGEKERENWKTAGQGRTTLSVSDRAPSNRQHRRFPEIKVIYDFGRVTTTNNEKETVRFEKFFGAQARGLLIQILYFPPSGRNGVANGAVTSVSASASWHRARASQREREKLQLKINALP